MARRTKIPTQPTIDNERQLEGVVDNNTDYVEIRGKRFGFRPLGGWARHKISLIMLKKGGDEFAVSCKCLAAAKLHSYFRIKFLWWLVWRWYYYVRNYTETELMEAFVLIKKKVAAEDYWAVTMLQIGMRETMMQMNREEVSATLREHSGDNRGKSAKSDLG